MTGAKGTAFEDCIVTKYLCAPLGGDSASGPDGHIVHRVVVQPRYRVARHHWPIGQGLFGTGEIDAAHWGTLIRPRAPLCLWHSRDYPVFTLGRDWKGGSENVSAGPQARYFLVLLFQDAYQRINAALYIMFCLDNPWAVRGAVSYRFLRGSQRDAAIGDFTDDLVAQGAQAKALVPFAATISKQTNASGRLAAIMNRSISKLTALAASASRRLMA